MKTQLVSASIILSCLGFSLTARETSLPAWAIGPFTRANDGQPVIGPNTNSVFDCPLSKEPVHWEKAWAYNPGAVVKDGKIIVFYRAQQGPGNSCSRVGYAISGDGIHFKTDPAPVLFPANDSQRTFEWSGSDQIGGCEDPRLAESPDGFYVMTYTQYDGHKYRLGLATSKNLKDWIKRGSPFAGTRYENYWFKSASIVHQLKDGRLVAVKIKGKYWMYFDVSGGKMATSEDLIHWTPLEDGKGGLLKPMPTRPGFFDSGLDEIGPQAVLTRDGIVVFYNGMNSTGNDRDPAIAPGDYSGGQALFDKNDPTRLIARLNKPFIQPELPWEKTGLFKHGDTFIEGLVFFKHQWFVYYGCANALVGLAVGPATPSTATDK
jgi:beta-1,2-mannosidase